MTTVKKTHSNILLYYYACIISFVVLISFDFYKQYELLLVHTYKRLINMGYLQCSSFDYRRTKMLYLRFQMRFECFDECGKVR